MYNKMILYTVLIFLSISCSPGRKIDKIMVHNRQIELLKGDTIFIFSTTDNKPMMKKDVVYFWYYKNSLKTAQGHYNGKLLHGTYQMMNRDHRILKRGEFSNGLKHKEWVIWHDNGLIKSVETWKDGKLHGPFMQYNEEGKLFIEGNYKNDLYHGKMISYLQDTVIKENYRNGALVIHEKKVKEPKTKETKIKKKTSKAEDMPPSENMGQDEPL